MISRRRRSDGVALRGLRAGVATGRPAAGAMRTARAAALGGLSLMLATGAHLVGGGSLPGPGVLLVAGTVLGLVAAVLTGRRLRFAMLLTLLGAEQVALHVLFGLAAAARLCGTGTGVVASDMVHGPGAVVATTCGAGGMPMATGPAGRLMWVAHLAAVVATAWLLARGEAWVWRVVDRVVLAAGLGDRRGTRGRRLRLPVPQPVAAGRASIWRTAGPRGPPVPGRA